MKNPIEINDISEAFNNCSSLSYIPDISKITIKNKNDLLYNCISLLVLNK